MDIGGINSEYLNNILGSAKTKASGAELESTLKSFQGVLDSKLEKTSKEDTKTSEKEEVSEEDEKLREVCKEFEAYFFEQVFKEMQKSIKLTDSEDAASNQLIDYYKDNLTSEYSKLAAGQQENGLAQMLYEQMKRNISTD